MCLTCNQSVKQIIDNGGDLVPRNDFALAGLRARPYPAVQAAGCKTQACSDQYDWRWHTLACYQREANTSTTSSGMYELTPVHRDYTGRLTSHDLFAFASTLMQAPTPICPSPIRLLSKTRTSLITLHNILQLSPSHFTRPTGHLLHHLQKAGF